MVTFPSHGNLWSFSFLIAGWQLRWWICLFTCTSCCVCRHLWLSGPCGLLGEVLHVDPTSFLMIIVHFPSCHCPFIISQQHLPFLFEGLLVPLHVPTVLYRPFGVISTSWGEMGLGDRCQSDEKHVVNMSISTAASCVSTKCNIGPILPV